MRNIFHNSISILKRGNNEGCCYILIDKLELQMTSRLKLQWTLYNISVDTAPIVATLYWGIAYDGKFCGNI